MNHRLSLWQHQLNEYLAREGRAPRCKCRIVLEFQPRNNAMRLGRLLHTHLGRFRLPILIFRTKPFNVRFPEILLRPIRLRRQVASHETLKVLLRKRLVSEQRDRILLARPFAAARLIAKPRNCPGLRVDPDNKVRSLNRFSRRTRNSLWRHNWPARVQSLDGRPEE